MSIYILVAVGAAALAVAAGFWDGYRLRREARYSPLVLAISAAGPVVSLVLFVVVGGMNLKVPVTVGLLVFGAVTGAAIALLARLYVVVECEDDAERESAAEASPAAPPSQVRLVGASWLPLPAAFAVAALQIASAMESIVWEAISLAALEAAVAFGVVSTIILIRRRSQVGPIQRDPAETPCLDTPPAAA